MQFEAPKAASRNKACTGGDAMERPQLEDTRSRLSNSGIGPEPHPALQELDPSTSFLYQPRTITFGAIGGRRVPVSHDETPCAA